MNSDKVTLIYEGEHAELGSIRLEVTPNGYGPTTVSTYLNGQFVGKCGYSDIELQRNLKGLTLVDRVAA